MPEENKKNWANIVLSFVLLVIAIAVIAVVNKLTTPVQAPVVTPPAEQTTDEPKQGTTTVDVLTIGSDSETASEDINKFNSYKKFFIYPNGLITPTDYISNPSASLEKAAQKIKITGNIEDAYIYIKAGANDENGNFTSIMKKYDGVWFYLENGVFLGGQLDLSKSIFGQTSNLTELLYNFNSVPVAQNLAMYRSNKYEKKNFLKDLKDERKIGSMVSTSRYGKIEKVIIAYKCQNGSDCKIE